MGVTITAQEAKSAVVRWTIDGEIDDWDQVTVVLAGDGEDLKRIQYPASAGQAVLKFPLDFDEARQVRVEWHDEVSDPVGLQF